MVLFLGATCAVDSFWLAFELIEMTMLRVFRPNRVTTSMVLALAVSVTGCTLSSTHPSDKAAVNVVAEDRALIADIAGFKISGDPQVAPGTSDGPFESPGYVFQTWVALDASVDLQTGVDAVADEMLAAGWSGENEPSTNGIRTVSKGIRTPAGDTFGASASVSADPLTRTVKVVISLSEAGLPTTVG